MIPLRVKTGLFGNSGAMGFAEGGGERCLRGARRFDASQFERLKVSGYL